eukprot:Gregarina_sp_Poly_1__8478@NODE_4_length_26097_cov_247_784211_g3_i0_p1_GENE_NODE_4_length_26097_cov_247_784211_g3_i0NODE_4_length_26097_cov_247_784211_g3_i0_p1_ORF_typecomplete_len1568_score249_45DCB/PF16213_5/0_094DCB/PF16213_5/3_5e03CLASP_N/PF12348_8/8CLASP_N/PF12348_8/7_4e03CLASP_N/PF12348_8/5_9DUF2013/PF09431_10/2_3e03DUF2013/PF09431_10/0_68PHD/PF00628_29/12PHD/PF00628_29/2_3e02_NODE_4_length_26097_cov_247_784211_g3_i028597562
MVVIITDVLDRDVVIENELTVSGPMQHTPDGLCILRCVGLILRFLTHAEAITNYSGNSKASHAMLYYRRLPIWTPEMNAQHWDLSLLRNRWVAIQELAKNFSHTLVGHLNWKASLLKAGSPESSVPLKRRVALMKRILTDVANAALSPWYPAAPHFLLCLGDSLIRMAYDSHKSPTLLGQVLLDLVNHAFFTFTKYSQNVKSIIPLVSSSEDRNLCACGDAPVDDEPMDVCETCLRRFHLECLPCEECVLCRLARDCGAVWLENFCRCFKAAHSMHTLSRRSLEAQRSVPLAPEALPENAIGNAWRFWVVVSRFLCQTDTARRDLLHGLLALCSTLVPSAEYSTLSADNTHQSLSSTSPFETPSTQPRRNPARQERRRRRAQVLQAEEEEMAKEEPVRLKQEFDPTPVSRVRIGVGYEECCRELTCLTLGLSDCYVEGNRFLEVLNQGVVSDLQLHMVLKVWALLLDRQGFLDRVDKTLDLLLRVVGARLMALLMNPSSQTSGVKIGEALIGTLTSMIVCVQSATLHHFSADLRTLFEEVSRAPKLKFSTKKCFLVNLNRIVSAALESEPPFLYASLPKETRAVFIAGLPKSAPSPPSGFVPSATLASHKRRLNRSSIEEVPDQSELSLFLLWTAQLCLSVSVEVQSLRLEVWKILSLVLFTLSFKSKTYKLILEKLVCQLNEDENASVRALLLKTFQILFFSQEAVAMVMTWAHSGGGLEERDNVSDMSVSMSGISVHTSNASTGDAVEVDFSAWPMQHQWICVLVSILSFAERKQIIIRNEDGSETSLIHCCVSPETANTVIQRLTQLLIEFFVFTKSLPNRPSSRFYQRCVMKTVTVLSRSFPRILLQVAPFALPYVLDPPATATDVQLASQICPLLQAALETDRGVLGSIEFLRSRLQPVLVRLTRIRGSLSEHATRLLVTLVRLVTRDFRTVLVPLISRDFALLVKALRCHQEVRLSTESGLNMLLNSPLFHTNNLMKLQHAFSKIAAVVDVVDFPEAIEAGDLSLEDVTGWLRESEPITRATAIPIVLYDLFCDIYLEFREIKLLGQKDPRVLRLETELMGAVVLVLGNLVKFYKDFVRSSRLTQVFSDALESTSPALVNQALVCITRLFKSTSGASLDEELSPPVRRSMTPTSVSAGGGTRSLQPLCLYVAQVCRIVRELEVPYPLPLMKAELMPQPPTDKLLHRCRLNALELFNEMAAQGFVSPSDVVEPTLMCLLLGDRQIEQDAAHLASVLLTNVQNPAAMLRRRSAAVMLGFHKFAVSRLQFQKRRTGEALSVEDIDFPIYIRPFADWFARSIRPKSTYSSALIEGFVGSLAKPYSLGDALWAINPKERPGSPIAQVLDAYEFMKSFILFCSSFLLSLPLGHVGELRDMVEHLQILAANHSAVISLGPTEPSLDSETVGDEFNTANQLHKSLTRKLIILAVSLLLRSFVRAYHIEDNLRIFKKRMTAKEAETKTFTLVSSQPVVAEDETPKSMTVKVSDLSFPHCDYEQGVQCLDQAIGTLRNCRNIAEAVAVRAVIEDCLTNEISIPHIALDTKTMHQSCLDPDDDHLEEMALSS